ncbi:2'-5' RNA ligase family protein [Roseomonas sp. HJA6]|uniref:2'-5' RNA ligase family protein n=1 Tax=Roseomonas alba TaxID=2846776 RepID=A0ABS7AD32_9PROT|nr:2'-5' RNA ligase family protein [Neoroseomonas alba]MBW6400206.1 2'-5' RNA ligase family protein [Neoroseomonas alba]
MPYAVTLRLDAEAAAPIEAMWRALADAGLHEDSLALGYPPHVTLTIHPDGVDAERIGAAMARCAASWDAIDLRIAGFGIFAAPVPVLYLAPVVTSTLLMRHQALAEALSDLPGDPHYRPGAWVPHITLAKGGPATEAGWMGQAFGYLAPLWSGLRPGRADRLELVHFRPVAVLRSLVIRPGLAAPSTSV